MKEKITIINSKGEQIEFNSMKEYDEYFIKHGEEAVKEAYSVSKYGCLPCGIGDGRRKDSDDKEDLLLPPIDDPCAAASYYLVEVQTFYDKENYHEIITHQYFFKKLNKAKHRFSVFCSEQMEFLFSQYPASEARSRITSFSPFKKEGYGEIRDNRSGKLYEELMSACFDMNDDSTVIGITLFKVDE